MRRTFKVQLCKEDSARLFAAAQLRTLDPESLVEVLLQHVLRDNLVDAVIDEERQQQVAQ